MSLSELLLLGAGGHARACIDVIEHHGGFRITGLVGRRAELGEMVLGYRILACDEELHLLVQHHRHVMVTVGQIKSPDLRIRLHASAKSLGFQFPAIVSPRAYVSRHAAVGSGTIVMHGAMINAGASVGENCIINSNALVEHDTHVADHCHISTGAVLNGGVRVGTGTFVGSSAVVREGIELGERCLVGMGVLVRVSQPNGQRLTR